MLRKSLLFLLFLAVPFLRAEKNHTSATELFSESFEGSVFPPSGWTVLHEGSSNNGWKQSTSKSHSGSASAYIAPDLPWKSQDDWLVTPAIDLSGEVMAKLVFYEDQVYWESDGQEHYIMISTTSQTDINSFSQVLLMQPSDHKINGFNGDPVVLYLPEYAGYSTVYIAFRYKGSYADYWYIDDVSVYNGEDHDVRAISLDMDSHYAAGTVVQPSAQVQNVGNNEESFTVYFGYYNWDGSEEIIDSYSVVHLGVGEKTTVVFNDYTMPADVQYTYFAKTDLSTDQDHSNDAATRIINTFTLHKRMVLTEKGTGVTCPNCVGASRALDSLYEEHGDSLAIVEYHNYQPEDDPFSNDDAAGRTDYYNITGYPTVVFGGEYYHVGAGGCDYDWSNLYNNYENSYEAVIQEYTGLRLDLNFSESIGSDTVITAVATTTYHAASYVKTFKLRYALVENHIPYEWEDCMDSVQFCERKMYQDYNGKDLYTGTTAPYKGMTIKDTLQFTFPSGVVKENSDLVAFIQDDATKEVVAVARINLANPTLHVAGQSGTVKTFTLRQNYPNPFNPVTTITYTLSAPQQVTLEVYNAVGQKVAQLVNETQTAGEHEVVFDGAELASGIYYYRLATPQGALVRKMLLVK